MGPVEIDLRAIDRGTVTAPAGCGKTQLIAHTLASAEKVGVPVSLCGEMAGDPEMTRLLLGMGLRIFSMHPSQILKVKNRILKANIEELAPNVRRILRLDEPGKLLEALEKLNA